MLLVNLLSVITFWQPIFVR
uniref:Uncharacterized protein n=1 Tax=Anguilla anguilla TaxID=7936 RepID=A0A0E9R2I4_ANGAN